MSLLHRAVLHRLWSPPMTEPSSALVLPVYPSLGSDAPGASSMGWWLCTAFPQQCLFLIPCPGKLLYTCISAATTDIKPGALVACNYKLVVLNQKMPAIISIQLLVSVYGIELYM